MHKLLTFSILAAMLAGSTGCTMGRSPCDPGGCSNPFSGCGCFDCFRSRPRQPEVYCAPQCPPVVAPTYAPQAACCPQPAAACCPQQTCCDPCATTTTMLAPQALSAPMVTAPIMTEAGCNCQ